MIHHGCEGPSVVAMAEDSKRCARTFIEAPPSVDMTEHWCTYTSPLPSISVISKAGEAPAVLVVAHRSGTIKKPGASTELG